MKKTIINIIIVLVVIGVIVGFNQMMNSNEHAKIKHEEVDDGHDHGGGPKILDATLKMGKVCVINTEKGSFDVVLLQKDIRNATAMFYSLAKGKKYDGVKFPEVKDWVVRSDFATKEVAPIETEQAYGLNACRGAVGLCKGNKSHEQVSAFYIIKECSPSVSEGFTVFGYVVKGMDVVDKISENDTIKNITFRKANKEDENTLIELIKEGQEDSKAVQMAGAKAEQEMMKKQAEMAEKAQKTAPTQPQINN